MDLIAVTCPECGHARQTSRDKIPPRPVTATCPVCRANFPFSAHLDPPGAEVPVAGHSPLPAVAPEPPSQNPSFEPPAEPPPVSPEIPRQTTHRFVFSGSTGEYFGIWIVNLLLKVVTLGLYSAWAKVRKRRYFYGHTRLDGVPFDYIADPKVIFRGWCIGAAAFILYSIGSRISPILGLVLGLALFLAIPWVIVRARIFHARNSTHRNIRFTFRPNYREAYEIFAGLPILLPFTLGLLAPYIIYRQKKFFIENSGFGTTPFTFHASPGTFYRLFIKAFLWLLLAGIVFAVAAGLIGLGNPGATAIFTPAGVFGFLLLYFTIGVYLQTELTNLTWNATRLGDAQIFSTLRTRDMIWLLFSSAAGIALSFGLLIPWAAVRLTRYRMEQLGVSMAGEIRTLAAAQPEVGATGEEFGDIFGIEVGLG